MNHPASPSFASNLRPRRFGAWLTLLAAALLLATGASAQVDVTASAGTPNATYPTLKDAFDAINAGTHQAVITIAITGDTTETAPAVLNASGSGSALYTSIGISPSGGAARTISGAIAAGSPLIDLNGADNVTIDGLNTGGNSLTISNTTVSATSGTSTIRFQADATGNVVTNTSILGSSTMTTTTNGGNIWFGAGAVATGNDNNTISNCDIGPAGANLPTKAVYGNGSTTTTTLYNSGIILNNNNIFDFFNAAAQSNGVYLAGGNSDWTISNNRFYQTATRTQTTGAIHSAIQVANVNNNNHAITGNTIGYSSSAGTGTYTFVGVSASSKFLPIYFSSAGTTTASSIQGNAITAINLSGVVGGTSTTGAFVGISIGSGLANIGNVTGNTVGSASTPGAISITSANAAAMEVYGIYYFPSAVANVSNNTVAGITSANSGAGSLVFYGIRAFTTSSVTNTMANNTVGTAAAPLSNTSASTSSRIIGLYCQSGACVVTGNTISNLSMSAANVGTGSTASVIGLWIDDTSATIGNNVAQNTVRSLANNDPAAAVWVTGMQYNGATTGTPVVQRNFIHSISTPSTSATATVNGINVQGGLTTFQNNMIALGGDMTANSPQINGINETVAGTDNFYFNSVYVGGAAVAAGTANSFAFQSSITTNTRNYRDNVFYNARSNGAATGKHYAIRVGGTAPNPAGLTSNNNVLLANGTGGFTGLFNLVDQPNLAAWQAATGQDPNSFALDPQYQAPAAATPDLHINPAIVTAIEGNGVAVGSVTDDFDGQARAGLTPTDIGADAGNFLGVDLTPPAISYTVLGNTSSTANRTLTATLVDVTGVATGGLAPRIYYRKGAGSYFSQACSLTGGTVNNGTWDCVVNNADLGGVTTADVISYFVIAQDTAAPANIGSNPAGAVATDVNNVTTPPAVPNSYTIVTAFTGSYDIGTGQTYTSLTNAGGIFEAINGGALTGNVVLNIVSDLAGELGTNALNQWAEDGVGGYTMLIKPSGAPRAITGSFNGALIRFFGTDRVRLDGSTAATFADAPTPGDAVGGNPLLRELTIQNTNVGTAAVVIAVQSGAAGAQNVTLKNLNVIGQDPTTTLVGIALGGNTVGSPGTDNDNNRVENCSVKRVIYGIYSAGLDGVNPNLGSVITQNDLSATGADRVRRVGMFVVNEDGAQITENALGGIDTNESADAIGIALGIQNATNTTTTSGNVTNALVARNRIAGVNSASTTGFSAAGIAVAGGTAGANTVVNNMISGVISPATSPDIVAGIFVAGVTGSTTRLYFNSVSMTGDRGVVASQAPSFALAVTGTDPTVVLRDNLLATTQTSGGGVNAKSYAIGMVTTTFANLDSNYNGFFSSGANAGFFRSGSLGGGAGTDYANLAAWAAAVADDANSFEADPLFTSATDLHILTGSPAIATGTPVAGVTVDFDGETRSATTPSIGADEFIVPADLSITKTDGVTTALPGGSVVYTIVASNAGPGAVTGATVADTFPAECSTVNWTCVGAGGGTCTAAGSGNISDTVDLPVGGTATYTATCNISLAATGSLVNTATVSSSVSDPVPANNSATDTDTLLPIADASITKTDGVASVTPGGNTTYTIVASNAGPAATNATVADTFPATLTCSWTCLGAGGGTCTAAGSGNINDSVSLPAGGSVTYTAPCTVSPSATGTVVNTATVTPFEADPNPANNSATDTDVVAGTAPAASVVREAEPNGTPATATPLGGRNVHVYAAIYPNADEDYFSFTAAAGDKVYAATMTSFSANGSFDSVLDLFASDGTTVIENDDNDGSFGTTSSSIAGATIASPGTYYLRVRHFSATGQLRPYELYVRLQSGSEVPTPETEPNDTPATANPLPPNGWVSGARNPAVGTEQDWYSFTANAGDTIFLNLDLDPERDNVQWNGRLGIALFGDAGNQILVVDDGSTGSLTNPLSEAQFMTVKTSGTYYAFVDSATAGTGGPTATYALSVSIHPAVDEGVSCTTYTSTDVPQTIGPGAGLVSSTITVPGNPRIADLDVSIQLNHALMGDIDAHLRSPAGNDNGLFTDIGAAATGGQTQMDAIFDDEAAIPPLYTVLRPMWVKPELNYRMSWFDGEDAGGTWTLDLRDDGANVSGGTLTGWSIRICEPAPQPACGAGTTPVTVYTSDFESGDAGFTHSGTADEWARGLPTAVPITTCNSGVNCWKTDLTGTYNASSNQDLLSPTIDLSTAGLSGPVLVTWSQRYQMESTSFDHAFVDAQDVDAGLSPKRLWEWLDATMTNTVGSPTVTIQESAGWARRTADVSSFLGQNDFQLRFHLDSDTTVQLGGLAIDDVTVTACQPIGAGADLSITKTDGVGTATPGTSTTYTITASNAGPTGVTGATVADTFPADLTCTWTCVGAGGGTCTAAGAGNINDSVNLPNGGSVTYTASCNIAASAFGTLSNTATVSSAAPDPVPGNNSATDTDTLTPSADLSITKADDIDPIGVHRNLVYSITVTNNGPSDSGSSTVTDVLPAGLSFVSASANCSEAGGTVTCNIPNLAPAGAQLQSIVVQTTQTGSPSNTATVSSATSDPNPGNNSASQGTTVQFKKGDFENDLQTDLYIGNTVAPANHVWLMNGVVRTTDQTFTDVPATVSQQISGVDDFNGDSWNDLVFWDSSTGVVEFWLMNGTATRPGAPVPISGAPTLAINWKLSATADFNADGKPDIVWRNFTSQKIVIWTMNGTTKVGNIIPTPDQAVDPNWEIVGAFDMNNDGNTDFLWYNYSSGKIVYWWMDASVVRIAGNFTVPPAAVDANWKVLAAGDYGVGAGGIANTKDVVWRNATSGSFVVWYMDFAGNRTFGTFTTPASQTPNPTDWTIVGPR